MCWRVLPAEIELTVVAFQAHYRGTSEQSSALLAAVGIGEEARFQDEHGLGAAIQVLGAMQALATIG